MLEKKLLVSAALLTAIPVQSVAAPSDTIAISKADFIKLCENGSLADKRCETVLSTPAPAKPAAPPAAPQSGPQLPTLSQALKGSLPFGCKPTDKARFVRSDALDNFNYLLTLLPTSSTSPLASGDAATSPNAVAKGLGVSFTDNYQAKTQATTIDGRISYLLFGAQQCENGSVSGTDSNGRPIQLGGNPTEPFVEGFGFGPFVGSDGSWNEPITTTTTSVAPSGKKIASGTTTTTSSNGITTTTVIPTKNGTVTTVTKKYALSALSFGADFQLYLSTLNLPSNLNFFYVSPYYQTDYLGAAKIGGVDVAWEPVVPHLLNDGYINPNFYFYTGFRAEADFSHVSNPGLTLLTEGQHDWIGETFRPNLTLFPLVDAPDSDDWFTTWVRGRFSLIGTQAFFWDAATGQTAPSYQALLQYKLGACKVDLTKESLGSPCTISGSSSISLEYDWGVTIIRT
jgi:hypothetical protein